MLMNFDKVLFDSSLHFSVSFSFSPFPFSWGVDIKAARLTGGDFGQVYPPPLSSPFPFFSFPFSSPLLAEKVERK